MAESNVEQRCFRSDTVATSSEYPIAPVAETANDRLKAYTGMDCDSWWREFARHQVSPGIRAESLYLAFKARLEAEAGGRETSGLQVAEILCPHGWRRPEHGGRPCAQCMDDMPQSLIAEWEELRRELRLAPGCTPAIDRTIAFVERLLRQQSVEPSSSRKDE